MTVEAFKKQRLSSHETYKAKRWEGKPFRYQFKYLITNNPELAFMSFAGVIAPIIAFYQLMYVTGGKKQAMSKYKPNYTVVRDDDPNLEAIIKQKEYGREFFPQ